MPPDIAIGLHAARKHVDVPIVECVRHRREVAPANNVRCGSVAHADLLRGGRASRAHATLVFGWPHAV
eukprot:2149399-Prymnesium_polylepis.2